MKLRYIIVLLVGYLFWSGCNIINPQEQIPTYVHIDSFRFTPSDYHLTGSASHEITSAWIYYNNQAVGVYELPATIPILADKPGKVQIGPGINLEGFKDQKQLYPFYTFDTLSITPQPGKIISYNPLTKYVEGLNFTYKEDFEGGNTFTKYSGDTAIVTTLDHSKVFEGGGAGYLHLVAPQTSSESISQAISIANGESYIELNYKCDIPFQIGLAVNFNGTLSPPYYIIGVNPRDTWGKFYVSLQSFVQSYSSAATSFFIVIKANLDSGKPDGYVLLDNIKVVTY